MMARTAVWTAVLAIVMMVASVTGCSTGRRVDLGEGAAGSLVAAIAGEPDQLDPHKTTAYFSFEVLENVFDTLVEPDGNLQMRPALATSWEVSPDQRVWTFHLRPGVKFHDGTPLTADDVVFSYRRIIDEKLANSDKFSAVTAVEAPDPTTVVIRVSRPTPNMLTNIGGFKGMAIVSRRNVESGQIATHPIGTGPFRFAGQKSGDSISLVANPDYWDGPPGVPGVTFRFISEPSTALSALQAGEVDWTDSIPPQRVRQLSDDDSLRLAVTPSNDYWYLALNEAHAPYNDVRSARRSPTRSTGMRSSRRPVTARRRSTSSRSPRATRGTRRMTATARAASTRRASCCPRPVSRRAISTCWSPPSIRRR